MRSVAANHVSHAFADQFGREPELIVRAPGRINLMGDHTDYTGGLVLPIAIDRSLLIAARHARGQHAEVYSGRYDQCVSLDFQELTADPDAPWSRYLVGVMTLLQHDGITLRGVQLCIGGDLPHGAGLASSAALEVGVATALLLLAGQKLSPVALATLCRQAEHEYANSPCGIMDQLCCTSAREGHALLIDCRSMEIEHVPLKLGRASLVVIDTNVRHSIANGEYAQRRRECAAALAAIMEADASITSLRDVPADRLSDYAGVLDDTLERRVRHVTTENARVSRAANCLRTGDLTTLGLLMNESHRSLADDFEVSCDELNEIVSIANSVDGVYGARITGGGLGGCVIALASTDSLPDLVSAIDDSYNGRYDSDATAFAARTADAACVAEVPRDV